MGGFHGPLRPLRPLQEFFQAHFGRPPFAIDVGPFFGWRGNVNMIFRHPVAHAAVPPHHHIAVILVNADHSLLAFQCLAGVKRQSWVIGECIASMIPIDSLQTREETAFSKKGNGVGQLLTRHQVHPVRQPERGNRHIADNQVGISLVRNVQPLMQEMVLLA